MKRKIIIALAILLNLSVVYANEGVENSPNLQPDFVTVRKQKEIAFEKKLGLTEEQKIQAKEIRMRGHVKMRPVMEQIFLKKQEAKMVKMSRMAVQMQEERLSAIDAELRVLEKKARSLRLENLKEFESILTKEQKKILKQMKKDGRKKYQAEHSKQKSLKKNF